MTIENIENHMAYTCQCGGVNFALLKSGAIECNKCNTPLDDVKWWAGGMGAQLARAIKAEAERDALKAAMPVGDKRPTVSDDMLDFEARGYLTSLTFWHHLPEEDADELAAFFVNLLRERKKPLVKVVRAAAPLPVGELTDEKIMEIRRFKLPMSAGDLEFARAILAAARSQPATDTDDLYWRLHSLSKSLESSGRIDQHDNPEAYGTLLDAMNALRDRTQPETRHE